MATHAPALPFDARAAFVAGQAKSGTTLLIALLDSHPDLLVLPEETAYFPTVLTKFGRRPRREQFDYLTRESLARVIFGGPGRYANDPRVSLYADFPTRELLGRFEHLAFHPDNAGRDLLVLLLEAYAATLGQPLDRVRRWVEKTPANRDHLPAIRERFPVAPLLLTIRDPRAVLAARVRLERTRQTRRFSAWWCVAHWRVAARLALGECGRADVCVVPYEGLVNDPTRWMARACACLGVPAEGQTWAPTKAGLAWAGNSAAGTGFDAVSAEPAERWRKELSHSEIAWAENHCRDLMPALGYEPLLGRRSLRAWAQPVRGETPREYLKSRWKSLRGSLG